MYAWRRYQEPSLNKEKGREAETQAKARRWSRRHTRRLLPHTLGRRKTTGQSRPGFRVSNSGRIALLHRERPSIAARLESHSGAQ